MSVEKLNATEKEIRESQKAVLELFNASKAGKEFVKALENLEKTQKMKKLIESINKEVEGISPDEAFVIGQYLAKLINADPINAIGILAIIALRQAEASEKPERIKYYVGIYDAAAELSDSKEYRDFAIANQNFENDKSAPAVATRDALEKLQEKMKEISGIISGM